MDHLLDVVIGAVVAWALALEVRFQMEKAKNVRLQLKADDDASKDKIHSESDAEINADIERHIKLGN
jgi:hypothetical protein